MPQKGQGCSMQRERQTKKQWGQGSCSKRCGGLSLHPHYLVCVTTAVSKETLPNQVSQSTMSRELAQL